MIKAVFFDVDGTLVSHKSKSVPKSTKRAIERLKEKGIKVCLATGRHMLELEELPIKDLSFDGYVMLSGQLCYDAEKRLIAGTPLKKPVVRRFIKMFDEKKIPLLFGESDRAYLNFVNDDVRKTQADISSSVPDLGEYQGAALYQVCAFIDGEQAAVLRKTIPDCKITSWHPTALEFISAEGGKSAGIQKMLEYLGAAKEEIIAFGDGENDMEMLKDAKIGVAMGNAEEDVKKVADYVTSDVDDDGIEKALQHFKLI